MLMIQQEASSLVKCLQYLANANNVIRFQIYTFLYIAINDGPMHVSMH